MPLLDWSMTMIGYPRHQRSGSPVVGVSHMSAHAALRMAEAIGYYTGWVATEGPSPHLDGIEPRRPQWVALAEFFVERRIAYTEGMVSGSLVYASAVPADGEPPSRGDLRAWAEDRGKPWVEVVDNEFAYWGGVDDQNLDALLRAFLCRRPLEVDWRQTHLAPEAFAVLRTMLFDHGLTRNLSLVKGGRKASVELWGGVHARCMLAHDTSDSPSAVQDGVALNLRGGVWRHRLLESTCPFDDDRGRVAPHPGV